jgi:hypothetical protein
MLRTTDTFVPEKDSHTSSHRKMQLWKDFFSSRIGGDGDATERPGSPSKRARLNEDQQQQQAQHKRCESEMHPHLMVESEYDDLAVEDSGSEDREQPSSSSAAEPRASTAWPHDASTHQYFTSAVSNVMQVTEDQSFNNDFPSRRCEDAPDNLSDTEYEEDQTAEKKSVWRRKVTEASRVNKLLDRECNTFGINQELPLYSPGGCTRLKDKQVEMLDPITRKNVNEAWTRAGCTAELMSGFGAHVSMQLEAMQDKWSLENRMDKETHADRDIPFHGEIYSYLDTETKRQELYSLANWFGVDNAKDTMQKEALMEGLLKL